MPEGIDKILYVHHILADTYDYMVCKDLELFKIMWLPTKERVNFLTWPTDCSQEAQGALLP